MYKLAIKSVEELLDYATTKSYMDALDAMWEAWITHEMTDTTPAMERARMLYLYKQMRKFYKELQLIPEEELIHLAETFPEVCRTDQAG